MGESFARKFIEHTSCDFQLWEFSEAKLEMYGLEQRSTATRNLTIALLPSGEIKL